MVYGQQNLCQQEKNNLTRLQLELDQLCEDKARGAFVRSRRKRMEGENTKYFFNLEKRNAELSSLIKLNIDNIDFKRCKRYLSFC